MIKNQSLQFSGADVRDHVNAVVCLLNVGSLDLEVGGRCAEADFTVVRHDAVAIVGGFDEETVCPLGNLLSGLVREVPGESLDSALGRRGAGEGVHLFVGQILGIHVPDPGRDAGGAISVAALRLGAIAAATLGGKLRDEEGFDDLSLGVLDPDGILVGAGAGLFGITEGNLQAAWLGCAGGHQRGRRAEHQEGKDFSQIGISWCMRRYAFSADFVRLLPKSSILRQ